MNVRTNACPNCNKISGLVAVGPDFEHLVEEVTEEIVTSEVDVLVDGKIQKRKAKSKVIKKQIVAKKGTGSLCRRCGWSLRDPMSIHYDAACTGCGAFLGRHAVDEGKAQKKHYCQKCSFDRISREKHDPDDAVTTFVGKCAAGCGKDQAFYSVREGSLTERPYSIDADYFCTDKDCQERYEAAVKVNKLAKDAAAGSAT